MEIAQSYEQLNSEYSMLMGVLGASVSKHLLDGHYTCVWANDYYYDLIGYSRSEFESRFHNRPDEYFANNPESWKQLVESVEGALDAGENRNTLYLRLLSPMGEPYWVKLQAAFTDEEIDGSRVAYTIMTDVTEMVEAKQQREETRQAAEKIANEQDMLMSALRVSISKHLVDEHFTCIRANEYYYQLIGYPKEKYEALFHNHADEYYKNNPEGWALLTEKVMSTLEQGGDKYEAIIPMKYENGSSYWVKVYNYFTDEYIDGYRASYTVMTDVTELVQMRNEQDLLMQSMKVSVSRHLVDEHFTVVWANEFYYGLIGYTRQEYEALFHNQCDVYFQNNWESWENIQEKVREMRAHGKTEYEVFLPLKIPDGSTRWVKMGGFFTDEYQDGKQLAYTTMVDVSDLMRVQQEKTIAYDNIPGFIVKYRILPDKIVMTDASDQITDIFNINLNDLESFDPCAVLQPESRAMIKANHPRFRQGKPLEATIGAIDKYGRDRWFQIHSTCIDAISDDPAYLTIFIDITDITELRELQHKLEERTQRLNAALEEAKRANAAKSDFLSRMSHDIRTPMNAIAGMTEIADAHLEEPKRVSDCLQKIRLSSRHLLGLVNDVLDMSKIESGNFPLHIAPFSLREALREVVMITLSGVRERRQNFDVHLLHMEQEQFFCDALRLRQILLNLLSNAVKFTPEGGRIVFDVEQIAGENPQQTKLRFTVTDTGPGMKPEFLEHLFEAFTRERDSRTDRIEGSGLGMAIAKRLVDLLGGVIKVESTPGAGTTFWATLPMLPVSEPPVTCPAAQGVHILLSGSDPVALSGDAQVLQAMGVQVTIANGCQQAADLLESGAAGYSLILFDCGMPCKTVLQSVGRIRKAFTGSRPKLILASYDWSDIQEEVLTAGVDGFIEKPLFPSTMKECLQRYVLRETQPQQKAVPHDFTGRRFLLVEDNELNREIALELIGGLGAVLETAANGREAVGKFEESTPFTYDLILMDIQMPVMNGYEAARAIRTLPREDAKTVPIIAMTADAFVEDIQNAGEAGMNGHMSKPLDFNTLAGEISRYLEYTGC